CVDTRDCATPVTRTRSFTHSSRLPSKMHSRNRLSSPSKLRVSTACARFILISEFKDIRRPPPPGQAGSGYPALMRAFARAGLALHSSSAFNTSGATTVASDSMTNIGVSAVSLSQVIFSFGVAPEYDPYEVVESEIWQKYAQGLTGRSRSYFTD